MGNRLLEMLALNRKQEAIASQFRVEAFDGDTQPMHPWMFELGTWSWTPNELWILAAQAYGVCSLCRARLSIFESRSPAAIAGQGDPLPLLEGR